MLLLRTLTVLRKVPKNFQFRPQLHSFAVESNMNYVLTNLCQILSCSEQKALSVYQTFPGVRSVTDLSRIEQNFKLLLDNGVSKDLIGNNPFLLSLKIDALQRKLVIIKQMQPRQIDDFIPLLEMTEPVLKEVATKMATEHSLIPEKNRIYYLSRELQIAPATVSKYCTNFKLIFFASFTGVAKKLNILLDYNVDGEQILQSLYVFRCADKVFISRLEELFSNGLYDIKLWFFKCTDDKFRKLLVSEKKNAELPIELAHKINKRNLEKWTILNELNEMLSCDDKISAEIYYNFISNIDQIALAKTNIRLLTDHGVSLEFIRSNAVVLTLPEPQINDNIQLVLKMNPNSIEDFLPLIEVETTKLRIFTHNVANRPKKVPHPILYFSEKLNISPTTVSKYFAQHNQLFFEKFLVLKPKLDLLVSYNVQPMSILKSPHTFNLSLETIASTLSRLTSEGIEKISSWMLVCDTTRMKTVSARRVEEKNLFVESENTVDYVAKRLNWDESTKEKAIKYYPPLANCSVIKVKAHLDYLLNETHFTAEDINSNVAVFRTNLDELKSRMNELTSIGLIPEKLYFICLDRKRYLERVGKFCTKRNCPVTLNKFRSIEKRIKN